DAVGGRRAGVDVVLADGEGGAGLEGAALVDVVEHEAARVRAGLRIADPGEADPAVGAVLRGAEARLRPDRFAGVEGRAGRVVDGRVVAGGGHERQGQGRGAELEAGAFGTGGLAARAAEGREPEGARGGDTGAEASHRLVPRGAWVEKRSRPAA